MTRKYTEARKDSNRKWDADNLDRMSIAVPKGKRDVIKAHAESQGESVNSFIARAIDEIMFEEGERKMISTATIERRFRYRLKLHGLTLHREANESGEVFYYLTDDTNQDRPDSDDQASWYSFSEMVEYCERLAEEDAEYFAERRRENAELRAEHKAANGE